MGAGRTDATQLTGAAPARGWPLVVRRATEADREQVLGFASRTWDDWDYIPNAFSAWLNAPDGAFLVGTVGEPAGAGGGSLVDAEGGPLEIGRTVAVTRVAMLSPTEAWLEGIRVDPRVRGMGIAGDLQVAELHWVDAQGAVVLRYATGATNEASHRLGARDGIKLLCRFRAWWWSATGSAEEDDDAPSAFDQPTRDAATARRRGALAKLGAAGLLLPDDRFGVAEAWWRLSEDATFAAGKRLYEPRAWALQELTEDLFRAHAARGEVVRRGAAIAILVGEQLPSEDSSVRLALLCGDGEGAAALADEIHRVTAEPIRFRAPVDAPMITGHEDAFRAAGYVTPDWELHILARPMDDNHPIPSAEPERVLLADAPAPVVPPRW